MTVPDPVPPDPEAGYAEPPKRHGMATSEFKLTAVALGVMALILAHPASSDSLRDMAETALTYLVPGYAVSRGISKVGPK